MGKHLFIAEKPSVAKEFAKVLGVNGNAGNGYLESKDYVVTLVCRSFGYNELSRCL